MGTDPRIHRHTFVNGRCEVCSLDAEDLRPHEHVFDVNWNCTICRLSYKTIYGNNHDPRMQMTTNMSSDEYDAIAEQNRAKFLADMEQLRPDIDAIAKEALDQIWDSPDGVTKAQDIIVAAIRRAQVELKQEYAEAISERDALVKISEAADQLEALLSRNCGSNDDWPISLKVSGDYAQELAGKLTALTRALKPYREKMK